MQPVIQRALLGREEWLEGVARICLADVRKMFDSQRGEGASPAITVEFVDPPDQVSHPDSTLTLSSQRIVL